MEGNIGEVDVIIVSVKQRTLKLVKDFILLTFPVEQNVTVFTVPSSNREVNRKYKEEKKNFLVLLIKKKEALVVCHLLSHLQIQIPQATIIPSQ